MAKIKLEMIDEVTKEEVHSSLKLKAPLMLPSGEN